MSEVVSWLMVLGQQVMQQGGAREEGASVCFVGIAPILLAAAAVGLRAARARLGAARRSFWE